MPIYETVAEVLQHISLLNKKKH